MRDCETERCELRRFVSTHRILTWRRASHQINLISNKSKKINPSLSLTLLKNGEVDVSRVSYAQCTVHGIKIKLICYRFHYCLYDRLRGYVILIIILIITIDISFKIFNHLHQQMKLLSLHCQFLLYLFLFHSNRLNFFIFFH